MPKNLNIYWILFTALGVWFLFIHSPPILMERNVLSDAPFSLHLIGCYTLYTGCIFNTMVTPSVARGAHVFVGYMAMVGGVVTFVFGAWCSWWPYRENLPPRDFAIAISIGGVFQLILQARGLKAIRKFKTLKAEVEMRETFVSITTLENNADIVDLTELKAEKDKALRDHILNMVALFVVGCGVPASIRFAEIIGLEGFVGLFVCLTIMQLLIFPYGNTFLADKNRRPPTTEASPEQMPSSEYSSFTEQPKNST